MAGASATRTCSTRPRTRRRPAAPQFPTSATATSAPVPISGVDVPRGAGFDRGRNDHVALNAATVEVSRPCASGSSRPSRWTARSSTWGWSRALASTIPMASGDVCLDRPGDERGVRSRALEADPVPGSPRARLGVACFRVFGARPRRLQGRPARGSRRRGDRGARGAAPSNAALPPFRAREALPRQGRAELIACAITERGSSPTATRPREGHARRWASRSSKRSTSTRRRRPLSESTTTLGRPRSRVDPHQVRAGAPASRPRSARASGIAQEQRPRPDHQ